jgi:nicotinamidase-related amidase
MKLLVIVDFQNDYVIGSLGYPEAEQLEAPILRKIQSYLLNEDEVVFVLDTHAADYLYTEEGRAFPYHTA